MKKFIKTALFTGLFISFFNYSFAAEAKKTLEIGTEYWGSPWTFINSDNQPDGFEIEIVKTIAKKAGYDTHFNEYAWSGIFGALDSRRIDTVTLQQDCLTLF